MNIKAEKLQELLKEKDIKFFQMEELKGPLNSVIFKTKMEIENQLLNTMLIVDDSIYTVLRVQVADKVVKTSNKAAVFELLNELNFKYKMFKFYIIDNGSIIFDCCVPANNDKFDANMVVYTIVDLAVKHLAEFYPTIMQVVWSGKKLKAVPADKKKKAPVKKAKSTPLN